MTDTTAGMATENGPAPPGWRNAEGIGFYVRAWGIAHREPQWVGLFCSLCGLVQTTAEGPPSDLGYLSVVAQSHMERKHAGLLMVTSTGGTEND
jgi:hypothetical protein